MPVDLSFLRRRSSGIGGMSITAWWCCGCGKEDVAANTSCDALCADCRELDDQALVVSMAAAVRRLAEALSLAEYGEHVAQDAARELEAKLGEALSAGSRSR